MWKCHTYQLKELLESPLHPQPNFETDAATPVEQDNPVILPTTVTTTAQDDSVAISTSDSSTVGNSSDSSEALSTSSRAVTNSVTTSTVPVLSCLQLQQVLLQSSPVEINQFRITMEIEYPTVLSLE